MRCHRRRKERRSAAYFFAEPGLGRDFAFGLGTLSAGLVCLAVLGFGVERFVLVFFGMISSCLGRRQEADRRDWIGRPLCAYKATAVTAMRVHRQRKNGRRCDAQRIEVTRNGVPVVITAILP